MSRSANQDRGTGASTLIYVVDDDEELRLLLDMALRRAGFEVQHFPDAKAAMTALMISPRRPEVLVTDYDMPGMNGLELVAKVKEIAPEVKTLSISGTLELPELAEERCQPNRMLPKPFGATQFLAHIQSILKEG